jgi:hypothetical protein
VSDKLVPATEFGLFALIEIKKEPIGGCEQVLVGGSIVSCPGYATRQVGDQFGPLPIR